MKTSALRRWLVSLGLIALEQTTRFTGGHDLGNFFGFFENEHELLFIELNTQMIYNVKVKHMFKG